MGTTRWMGVALAVACSAALVVGAGPGPADEEPTHPEVDGAVTPSTCDSCHREVTPAVAEAWSEGRHGAFNVKCFVCHGSTGADFDPSPDDPELCVGCHAERVASLAAMGLDDPTCMTCHPAHRLDPHKAGAGPDDGGDS